MAYLNEDLDLIAHDVNSLLARGALHHAVLENAVPRVQTLLEIGVDPNAHYNNFPGPLFCASSVEMVSVLVAAGAAVGARTRNGCTPLHYAALRWGQKPGPKCYGVIAALVRAAADVNARTSSGHTLLELNFPHYQCIALAGQPGPSVRPATRSEFWRRRALLDLLRAGALVSNMERPELREALKRFDDFDQYCADHRRVWVSIVTKCAAIPRDAAGVVAAFVSPRGGY